MTTAAIADQEMKLEVRPDAVPVKAHEIGPEMVKRFVTDKAQ